jgi:energy-coupling factor transport system ATP-binding protein
MDFVGRLAERVVVMDRGKIRFDGTKKGLFQNPDVLASTGLTLPSVTKYMMSLMEKGWPVRTDVFTVEEAKEELKRAAESGKNINKRCQGTNP